MTTSVRFNLVQIVPDPLRGEGMNIGIAVHTEQGPELRLRLLPSRLRALSPALRRLDPQDSVDAWHAALARLPSAEMRWAWLRTAMAPLVLAPNEGLIHAASAQDLEDQIEAVLQRMVLPVKPPPAPARKAGSRRSRLNTQITSWLRNLDLYSRKLADLSKHRVVSGYPLSLEEEMFAEFALKNGVVHVMETLDLRGHGSYTKALRNETSHKAMVLDLAQDNLEPNSQRIALVAADNYSDMKPALSLLGRKASAVVNMDSGPDREWLASFIAKSLKVDTLLPPAPPAHLEQPELHAAAGE